MVTRRTFLQSAALAAGITGAASTATPANAAQGQGGGQNTQQAAAAAPPKQASELQVPKMKFGNAEISRVLVGVNPFVGAAHFNSLLGGIMREYYTQDKVCDVLHQCNRFGINAYNYRHNDAMFAALKRFEAEGGKMHLVLQEWDDPITVAKAVKPLGMHYLGEYVDRAFQDDNMDIVKEWCKKVRDTGSMVGVGTHKPEVIDFVESKGWDVDFYAGCIYNRTRTVEEWKQVLNGQVPEMSSELFLQSDPPKMYKAMRQTKKPCFAFKILAAGRIYRTASPAGRPASSNASKFPDTGQAVTVEQAFRTAFESIKPNDGIFVGFFPKMTDEVRQDVEHVVRVLRPQA